MIYAIYEGSIHCKKLHNSLTRFFFFCNVPTFLSRMKHNEESILLFITHMYMLGIAEQEIQRRGRWSSDAYKHYLRPELVINCQFNLNVLQRLLTTPTILQFGYLSIQLASTAICIHALFNVYDIVDSIWIVGSSLIKRAEPYASISLEFGTNLSLPGVLVLWKGVSGLSFDRWK